MHHGLDQRNDRRPERDEIIEFLPREHAQRGAKEGLGSIVHEQDLALLIENDDRLRQGLQDRARG
ncbi:hypothetical protein D3C87_2153660 [compost metagenome]